MGIPPISGGESVEKAMDQMTFSIHVRVCPETSVFIGSSEDIPGVCLETETFGKMKESIYTIVPEILKHNLHIKDEDLKRVVLQVFYTKQTLPCQPRFLIEDSRIGGIA